MFSFSRIFWSDLLNVLLIKVVYLVLCNIPWWYPNRLMDPPQWRGFFFALQVSTNLSPFSNISTSVRAHQFFVAGVVFSNVGIGVAHEDGDIWSSKDVLESIIEVSLDFLFTFFMVHECNTFYMEGTSLCSDYTVAHLRLPVVSVWTASIWSDYS